MCSRPHPWQSFEFFCRDDVENNGREERALHIRQGDEGCVRQAAAVIECERVRDGRAERCPTDVLRKLDACVDSSGDSDLAIQHETLPQCQLSNVVRTLSRISFVERKLEMEGEREGGREGRTVKLLVVLKTYRRIPD